MRFVRTLLLALVAAACLVPHEAAAQGCGILNPNCIVPYPPNGDSSNRAAPTSWVLNNAGGGGTSINVGVSPVLNATSGSFLNSVSGTLQNVAPTGTGNVVLSTSPVLTTPTLGVATANSINGLAITTTSGATLMIPNGVTFTLAGGFSTTFSLAGVTNVTFPTSGTLATTAQLTPVPISGANGGTGVANTGSTITLGGNLTTAGAFATTLTMTGATAVTLPTSGTLLGTAAAVTLAQGGTNNSLVADNGAVPYSDGSKIVLLASTVTASQCLLSGSSAAPTWGSCSGAAAVSAVSNSDGSLTISPTTGAVVASLAPGHANTWTAIQTFTNSDIKLLGSSTGATTFTSANAGASNFTLTIPALTDNVTTDTSTSTFTNKTYDTAGTGNSFSINGVAANANTGTGAVARAAGPTFTTPTLGVASATTVNKITLTTPASGSTLTLVDGKTLTASNTITLAGTDSTTWTGASTNMTIAALNIADQTVTGGANVNTSVNGNLGTVTGGTQTIDCGKSPLQYLTNNVTVTGWTIAAPSNDGSCIVVVTNNASGTLLAPSFSTFSVGANTGDTYATTNSNKYSLFVWRANSIAGYRWAAHQ